DPVVLRPIEVRVAVVVSDAATRLLGDREVRKDDAEHQRDEDSLHCNLPGVVITCTEIHVRGAASLRGCSGFFQEPRGECVVMDEPGATVLGEGGSITKGRRCRDPLSGIRDPNRLAAMHLAFGDFVFDSDTRELLRGSDRVTLSPKAFQLLEALIENRPRALSKSVLHDRLWANTFVVDANLSNLVGEIRHALGEDSRTPRFVRTVHRFGYAFQYVESNIGHGIETDDGLDSHLVGSS